ncbi:MAG: hypothetical protein BWY74_04437 [Firmicutes bacterium ADurb.Bin419]|nr:MAG: hypothetical protein BWY74_04437 [Firmicutes bacterium ADurb.Bin419]
MAFISIFLICVEVIIILMIPHINTIARACCHENPNEPQTTYVKNALRPIPGACAYGTLANNPITSVPITAARMVATKTAPLSIPVFSNIVGFTKMTYAIVTKVVSPAISSVLTFVPCSLSLNSFSIYYYPPVKLI